MVYPPRCWKLGFFLFFFILRGDGICSILMAMYFIHSHVHHFVRLGLNTGVSTHISTRPAQLSFSPPHQNKKRSKKTGRNLPRGLTRTFISSYDALLPTPHGLSRAAKHRRTSDTTNLKTTTTSSDLLIRQFQAYIGPGTFQTPWPGGSLNPPTLPRTGQPQRTRINIRRYSCCFIYIFFIGTGSSAPPCGGTLDSLVV